VAVSGLDEFARYFAGYEDCYTIIGGAACEILMSQTPIDFRATKDVDMIILFEDKFKEFAELFWNYVREGEYTYGWKNSNEPHFYRFTDPKSGYPKQIELFSRKPSYHLESSTPIVPIRIDDDVSSLSAILLNDDLNVLPVMMEQARRTHQIIRQNLTWASAYNLVAVPLAVFGYVTPWIAALGMSFSSLLVLGNALRLLKTKKAV